MAAPHSLGRIRCSAMVGWLIADVVECFVLSSQRCQPKTYATLAAITREFSSSLTDLRFTGNLVMGPREHGERVLRFWPRAPTNRPATATSSFDGGVHVMGVLSRVTSLHVDRCGFYQPDLFLMCNALGPVLPRLERINLFNNMHLSFPGPLGDAFGSSLTCLDLVGNSHSNGQGYFNLGKPLPACPILRALRMPLGSEAAISELPGFYPVLRELQVMSPSSSSSTQASLPHSHSLILFSLLLAASVPCSHSGRPNELPSAVETLAVVGSSFGSGPHHVACITTLQCQAPRLASAADRPAWLLW